MSLSVADIKSKTTQERVLSLSDTQIQGVLDITERILIGLGLNTDASGYTTVFNTAQLALFDWHVTNPNSLRSIQQGRYTQLFSLGIPTTVLTVLASIRRASFGELQRPGGV